MIHDERRTLLILGHGFRGQGQLWHSVYTLYNLVGHDMFCPITFKHHIQVVDDYNRNSVNFGFKCQHWHSGCEIVFA